MKDGLVLQIGEDGVLIEYEEPYCSMDFKTEEEFNRFKKLLEVGKAAECAFMRFEEFGMVFPFEIGDVIQLLEWYRGIDNE